MDRARSLDQSCVNYEFIKSKPLGLGLERISGVDLTRIDGIEAMAAQTVLSEVGLDMSRWKTEAHFSSWLGLCPGNRISGDRVLRRGTRRVINRAATALRMAATTLLRSQSYLGAQYRRLRTSSALPKPSRPWPTGSPDWSIAC
jgi:transposase